MRVYNWPSKFADLIESRRYDSFVWGKSDCVCFAADCVRALTGFDFLESYRGKYNDEASALQIIAGYGTLEAGLEAVLKPINATRCDTKVAMRGDLVLIEIDGRQTAGIWAGRHALAPLPGRGLCEVPENFVKACWGIV